VAILSVDLAYRSWSDVGIVALERAPGPALGPDLDLDLSSRGPFTQADGEAGVSSVPESIIQESIIQESIRESMREFARERVQNAAWTPGAAGPIACDIISAMQPGDPIGPVDANILAGRLNHLCTVRGMRVMMLDGPQAWKSSWNGLEHSRVSERQLNTAAKTGLPGMVKPVTYRAFAEFCLDVYDALCRRGWRRLETKEQPESSTERVLVESYPYAAWRALGLKPCPPSGGPG
jgi:hypothetical protein